MCGLPTETDEDVLQIADLAKKVIAEGPRGLRVATTSAARSRSAASCPSRTRRSSGPRSSTTRPPTSGSRSCATTCAPTRSTAGRSASATTTASPASSRDCSRAATAASAAVIEAVWRDGGRFDGWSEHFSYDRWATARRAGAGGHAGRPRLVHHPRARVRRGAALGPPGLRARQATGCGRTGRTRSTPTVRRGRGLPLDPVLRLRRLPADGHRDPDRPHRATAAAALRRLSDGGGRDRQCRPLSARGVRDVPHVLQSARGVPRACPAQRVTRPGSGGDGMVLEVRRTRDRQARHQLRDQRARAAPISGTVQPPVRS